MKRHILIALLIIVVGNCIGQKKASYYASLVETTPLLSINIFLTLGGCAIE